MRDAQGPEIIIDTSDVVSAGIAIAQTLAAFIVCPIAPLAVSQPSPV